MRSIKKIYFIAVFFLFCNLLAISQDNLLYFMGNVPQSNYLNPARLTDQSKVIINLPLFSGMALTLNNSFSFYDIGKINNNLLTIDMDRFYSNIPSKNSLTESFSLPFFGFQYRSKDKIFSFHISENQYFRSSFDRDLIKLINEGNNAFIESDFSTNFDFNFLHYREYSFGYSQKINDKLTCGSNIKLLTGFSAIDVKRLNVGLETASNFESVKLTARGNYNFCLPFSINLDSTADSEERSFKPFGYFTNSSNLGLAFDIGARYQLLPELELSASLIDLGFIHWKSDVQNISHRGSFTWKGFDLSDISNEPDINNEAYTNPLDALLDSVKEMIDLKYTSDPFNTGIPTKLYLAASYKVIPIFWAGFVDRIMFYDKQVSNSITLSGNLQLGRIFSLSAGYSVINKSFNNLALGTALKLGPIELYCLTGNILALNLLSSHNFNVQFGMNLMFGKNSSPQKNLETDPQ
jgi:hypothetical protein